MENRNLSSEDEGKTQKNQEESSEKKKQKNESTQPTTAITLGSNNSSQDEVEQEKIKNLGNKSEDSEKENNKNNPNYTTKSKSSSILSNLGSKDLNNFTFSKKKKKEKKGKGIKQEKQNYKDKEKGQDKVSEKGDGYEIELQKIAGDNEEQDEYHDDDDDDDDNDGVNDEDKRIVDFQNNKELYKKKYTDLCSEIDIIKLEINSLKTEQAKYEEQDKLTRKHYVQNQQDGYGLPQKENMKLINIEKRERELLREHKKLTMLKIQKIANKHNRKKKKKKKSNSQSNNNSKIRLF
ncbi:hypothetical protein M0813_25635 [Anaeramoeba flamelloides]|uniref:Uncharacterized protein n=1 Tax=Anaeramoeba flamelloides TaxID=1746091 RepID=A0ABQ8Y2H5_9EUKA|nr:hypothetical protein M0813_25635 [Anaeramoeba flamelloides]